jgi:hypothetical protein
LDKRQTFTLLAASALALAACAGGGADPGEVATLVAAQMLTDEAAAAPADTAAPPATAEPSVAPSAAPSAEAAPTLELPEVVFTPGGLFSDADRDLIMAKVIGPFIHYYGDLEEHPQLLTVHVQPYDDDPAWPYTADAIFAGGGYTGWLLPATAGELDWWVPDCMGPCTLSDSFRAAYPEIVAILEP